MYMEIHFYESIDFCPEDIYLRCDWLGTSLAIGNKEEKIYTTQMIFLETKLFELGYRIFVHTNNGQYEIKLGKNKCTNKEIKQEDDLFKMWCNGELNYPDIDNEPSKSIRTTEDHIEHLVCLRVSYEHFGRNIDAESLDVAINALHKQRVQEENKPLTIEELRQMDGEPVWVECGQCLKNGAAWCILEPCEKNFVVLVSRDENRFGRFGGMWDDYGKSWVAYRYKKEKVYDD